MQASSGRAACSSYQMQRTSMLRHGLRTCHAPAVGLGRRVKLECYAQSRTATVVEVEPSQLEAAPQTVSLESTAAVEAAVPSASVPQPEVPKFTTIKQLRLRSAAAYLPHVNKESYGGEDAHFISNMSGGAIGVADGVGGWAESGINPAEYSRTLMRVACAYIEGADTRSVATASIMGSVDSTPCASLSSVENLGLDSAAVVDPRGALDTAHKLTKLPGSATACVVQLDAEQRALIAANLGDSGFIIVRNGEIALRSSPKQHFFDCPLQFGSYPEHVDGTDTADDAEIFQFSAQPGDVIIAGSDGLWDNVYNRELLELIPKSPAGVDNAADKIAHLARRHAADPEFASPYTAEAKAQGLDWPLWMKVMNTKIVDGKPKLGELTGGKMDDITVLVAMVEEVDVTVVTAADADCSGSDSDGAVAAAVSVSSSAADSPSAVASSASSSSGSSDSNGSTAVASNGTTSGITEAAAVSATVMNAAAAAATNSSNGHSGAGTVVSTSSSSSGASSSAAAAAVSLPNESSGPNMFLAGSAVVLGAFMLVAQFF